MVVSINVGPCQIMFLVTSHIIVVMDLLPLMSETLCLVLLPRKGIQVLLLGENLLAPFTGQFLPLLL